MLRTGHLGLSLLVYAPLGYALLSSGQPELAVAGELGMVVLAMVPDVDHRIPFVKHRGATHTVGFALLVGVGVGAGARWLHQQGVPMLGDPAGFGFLIGTLAVLSHLVGDVLTPAGIKPFWPLWERRFSLSVAPSRNGLANTGLLLVGVGASVVLFSRAGGVAW